MVVAVHENRGEAGRRVRSQPAGDRVDGGKLAPFVGTELADPPGYLALVEVVGTAQVRETRAVPVELVQPGQRVHRGEHDAPAALVGVKLRRRRHRAASLDVLHQVERAAEYGAVRAHGHDARVWHVAARERAQDACLAQHAGVRPVHRHGGGAAQHPVPGAPLDAEHHVGPAAVKRRHGQRLSWLESLAVEPRPEGHRIGECVQRHPCAVMPPSTVMTARRGRRGHRRGW